MSVEEMNYEEIEKELFQLHNELRTKPQNFLPRLRDLLSHFKDKVFTVPEEEPIQTFEGIKAVEEAIEFIKKQKPVPELTLNDDITKACKDHIEDIGPKGMTTHEGSERSNISDRLEKYCEWDGSIAENMDFGFKKAENIILNMIIDDGVKERFQRMNLFNPDFKKIGIAVGEHKIYGICAVVGYCKNVRPIGSEPNDVADFISEYIKNTMYNNKRKNIFQEDDPDAPDNTVSVKIDKKSKDIKGKIKKITKKIYTLDTGAKHIVEIENC